MRTEKVWFLEGLEERRLLASGGLCEPPPGDTSGTPGGAQNGGGTGQTGGTGGSTGQTGNTGGTTTTPRRRGRRSRGGVGSAQGSSNLLGVYSGQYTDLNGKVLGAFDITLLSGRDGVYHGTFGYKARRRYSTQPVQIRVESDGDVIVTTLSAVQALKISGTLDPVRKTIGGQFQQWDKRSTFRALFGTTRTREILPA